MRNKRVLETIGELGFVEIYKNGKIQITPPAMNVHQARMEPFVRFLVDYKRHRPDFRFRGFFTLYDAWREHAEPSVQPLFCSCGKRELRSYLGVGTIGEPGRFIQPYHLKDRFPVFNHHILAFGRHCNDPFTIPVPDTDFIASCGYDLLRREVDLAERPWGQKIPMLYWRGAPHGFAYRAYDPEGMRSQRELLLEWHTRHSDTCDAAFSCTTTKREQLGFKYLLDIDGEVNAWSGFFWKLYSNSVVFKVMSHYEQWYYRDLSPWEHYIPVRPDLSDLSEKFEWALQNDEASQRIAENGKKFAKGLTYATVTSSLIIQDTIDALMDHYNIQKFFL